MGNVPSKEYYLPVFGDGGAANVAKVNALHAGKLHVVSTQPAGGKSMFVDLAVEKAKSGASLVNTSGKTVVVGGVTIKPGEVIAAAQGPSAEAHLKHMVGYFSEYSSWKKEMPAKFDTAYAEKKMMEYGAADVAATMDAKAAAMKLITVADVEKYLELRGYYDYEVVEADSIVIVEVVGIRGHHIEELQADIRMRLPVTALVEVWPR